MAKSLAGKICLVTGGTRGIGRGIALQLGGAGATVYVTGRTLKKKEGAIVGSLEDTAEEIESRGGVCVPVVCDHSDPEQVRAVFDRINKEQSGQLDVLVNNAYAAVAALMDCIGTPFWEQPESMWETVNNVGLKNHYLCSVHAAKMMVPRKKGLIVNISSAGGMTYFLNIAYGVGKAACDRLAADCAIELRKHNVTAVSLWPGAVQTEVVMSTLGTENDTGKDYHQPGVGKIPRKAMRKLFEDGETTECAGVAVVNLAQDPHVHKKTGRILLTGDLATEYGFSDVDGREVKNLRCVKNLLQSGGWQKTATFIPKFIKIPHFMLAMYASKF